MLMADMQSLSPEHFLEFAEELGLDMAAFQKSLADPKHAKHVDRDSYEAVNASAAGSPSVFVNGRIFNTRDATLNTFKARIDEELKLKKK
jgi:2-hydroxychromene-2-carboxylate isomerase